MNNIPLRETIYEFSRLERPMYRYAKRKHDETGATRRSTGEPYWIHPESVAKIAQMHGGTSTEIKAALAHDTIEDTGATIDDMEEKFGPEVTNIVREVTNDNQRIRELGKELYMSLKITGLSKSALFIKLCDMLNNSMDNPRPEQAERMKRNIDYLIAHRPDIDKREMDLIDLIIETLTKEVQ